MSGGRLLPWSGEGGKPCYLLADGDSGFISRMADGLEAIQLGMAVELLGYVDEALPSASVNELSGFVEKLRQSLRDASRVAGSRGERLKISEAPELTAAGALLATSDDFASCGSVDVLRGVVVTLREVLSGLVDLAERYGEELPQPTTDGAALRVVEVLHREIGGSSCSLLGAAELPEQAPDDAATGPSDGRGTGGGA